MKHPRLILLTLLATFVAAVYFRAWWILMGGFFFWGLEYASQEFSELKERLSRIESKLDAISTGQVKPASDSK